MMADAPPKGWEVGPTASTSVSTWLYVDDCDSAWEKAMGAGCSEIFPMADMFWGDRIGKLKDPYGHVWAIASQKWIYTPEEMQQKQQEMVGEMKKK